MLFCLSDGDGLDFDIGGKNSSKSTSTIKTSPKKVYRDDDYYLISSLVDSATDSMTVSEINKKHKKKEHEKEEEEF